MNSILTKHQVKTYGPRQYREAGTIYKITANVRYDDQCGNGHNSFSITADIYRRDGNNRWCESSFGCQHDSVAKHFPQLAPYIKWHLFSADQPLHYIANTVYHAGDRDHNGLRKGEERQIVNGRTKLPCWKLEADKNIPEYHDSAEQPRQFATLRYVPLVRIGEGKPRNLDAARSCAIWPDATDEELTATGLEDRLKERHAQLMTDFRAAVESLGFIY